MTSKLYHYTVEGGGAFPIDMLRYDAAWPRSENDSGTIHQLLGRGGLTFGKVNLTGLSDPTVGRWESFGWRVRDVEAVR